MIPSNIFTTPVDQNYINTSQDEDNINNCSYSFEGCKEEYYNLILNSFRKSKMSNSKENSFILSKNNTEQSQLPVSENGKVKFSNFLCSEWKVNKDIIKSNTAMMINFAMWSLNNNTQQNFENDSNLSRKNSSHEETIKQVEKINDLENRLLQKERLENEQGKTVFNQELFSQFLNELNEGKFNSNLEQSEENNENHKKSNILSFKTENTVIYGGNTSLAHQNKISNNTNYFNDENLEVDDSKSIYSLQNRNKYNNSNSNKFNNGIGGGNKNSNYKEPRKISFHNFPNKNEQSNYSQGGKNYRKFSHNQPNTKNFSNTNSWQRQGFNNTSSQQGQNGEYNNIQFKKQNVNNNTASNKISNFKYFNKFNIESNQKEESTDELRRMSYEPNNYFNSKNNLISNKKKKVEKEEI